MTRLRHLDLEGTSTMGMRFDGPALHLVQRGAPVPLAGQRDSSIPFSSTMPPTEGRPPAVGNAGSAGALSNVTRGEGSSRRSGSR
jgi:hypothetical protein